MPPAEQAAGHASPDGRAALEPLGDPAADLPYITPEFEGIGGFIKHRYADFLVEEIPKYDPVGTGEHCYLLVEKRGMATSDMLRVVADHFGVDRDAVGYAGMKDKYAVTRQVVSVHTPGRNVDSFGALEHPNVNVLWADMHVNKLRVGHLRGNRFSVKIRGVMSDRVIQAERTLRALVRRGLANYYGEQRFGARFNNHEVGRADIVGDFPRAIDLLLLPDSRFETFNPKLTSAYAAGDLRAALGACADHQPAERSILRALVRGDSPEHAVRAIGRLQRRFFLSAFQSHLFNRVCAARVHDATHDRLLEGDLAYKHANGAVFSVGEAELGTGAARAELDGRLRAFGISPSGPMWGAEMTRATGEPGMLEEEVLGESGVSVEALAAHQRRIGSKLGGTRRSLRVQVVDAEIDAGVDEVGHYVRCAFELPAGSFATVVMREIIKGGPREQPGTLFRGAGKYEPDTRHEHDEETG